MTDTQNKTLTLKRKTSGTGNQSGKPSRSGKRIILRGDLPNAKPAKPAPKPHGKRKPQPARPNKKKPEHSPSELRARELYQRLNDFEVWRSYKPLAIGIDKAVFKLCNDEQIAGASKKVVRKVLHMHVVRAVYRANVARGGRRYRLDGQPDGEVTEEQKAHALKGMNDKK